MSAIRGPKIGSEGHVTTHRHARASTLVRMSEFGIVALAAYVLGVATSRAYGRYTWHTGVLRVSSAA